MRVHVLTAVANSNDAEQVHGSLTNCLMQDRQQYQSRSQRQDCQGHVVCTVQIAIVDGRQLRQAGIRRDSERRAADLRDPPVARAGKECDHCRCISHTLMQLCG